MAEKAPVFLIIIDSQKNPLTFLVENALGIEIAPPIVGGFVGEWRQADNKDSVLVLTRSYLGALASAGESQSALLGWTLTNKLVKPDQFSHSERNVTKELFSSIG